jgi:transposase
MLFESLDQRIDAAHSVRAVRAFVEGLDLSPLYARIRAVQGNAGRSANDPRILLALWLYAGIEGVGSARQLDRLCRDHRAFAWLCGGVTVNYHTLAAFRVDRAEFLDTLFAQSIASLTRGGLVDVNLVAQDGLRIRASAGSDSFRREATWQEHLKPATEHLEKLQAELDVNPNPLHASRKAAQLRSAAEREHRPTCAIEHARAMAACREKRKPGDGTSTRASSTDPEARRMQMPDGGTRPAYNAQFGTDVNSGLIVGVGTTNAGDDAHELEPMLDAIRGNAGRDPKALLVDGGYGTKENVELADERGTVLYSTLRGEQKQLDRGDDPYAPRTRDSIAMQAFRARMGEAESTELYRQRGESAEWTSACARRPGLYMLRVRGLQNVPSVLVLFALAHDLLRAAALRAERQQENRG